MNSIEKYNIKDETGIHYKSLICSVAGSVGYKEPFSDLDYRIKELTQSFFNQWRFIIETYQRLDYFFKELNKCSDIAIKENIFSDYDIYATKHEIDFRDYSYLLIISIKTYLDLFVCLIDIIINQKIREEYDLPDLYKFGRIRNNIPNDIILELDKLKDKDIYFWIFLIKDTRDKIVHRGYHLKPKFGFNKSEDLIIQVYQGTDFYTNQILINIGDLFDSFMTEMPQIEARISTILIDNIEVLNMELDYELSYIFGDLINNYIYKEIKPSS